MRRIPMTAATVWLAATAVLAAPPSPQPPPARAEVPVESFTLDNGMLFLLVHKPELATVSAGWVALVQPSESLSA